MLRLYFKIKFPLKLEGFKINHSLFPKLAASQSRCLNFVVLPQFIENSQGEDFDTPRKGNSGRRTMGLPGNARQLFSCCAPVGRWRWCITNTECRGHLSENCSPPGCLASFCLYNAGSLGEPYCPYKLITHGQMIKNTWKTVPQLSCNSDGTENQLAKLSADSGPSVGQNAGGVAKGKESCVCGGGYKSWIRNLKQWRLVLTALLQGSPRAGNQNQLFENIKTFTSWKVLDRFIFSTLYK